MIARVLDADGGKRVHRGVDRPDPRERGVDQLGGCDLALAQELHHLDRGAPDQDIAFGHQRLRARGFQVASPFTLPSPDGDLRVR